jgi:transmembrane 9 superfamily protein 2/4
MLETKQCQQLCSTNIGPEDAKFINTKINEHYMMHWVVDGLPAGRNATSHYTMGFELGNAKKDSIPASLHNHYDITILYHANDKATKYRVVGVLVVPKRYPLEKSW